MAYRLKVGNMVIATEPGDGWAYASQDQANDLAELFANALGVRVNIQTAYIEHDEDAPQWQDSDWRDPPDGD